jgi:hypothetical protein
MPSIEFLADFPVPVEFDLVPMYNQVVNVSPFSRYEQVEPRADWWEAVVTWPQQSHDERHKMKGFFASLRGALTLVQLPIFDYKFLRGGVSGPVILPVGVHAGDTAITVSGMSGDAPYFQHGDMVQVSNTNPRVYIVTGNVFGSTIPIWPPIRETFGTGGGNTLHSLTTKTKLSTLMRLAVGASISVPAMAFPKGGIDSESLTVRFVEPLRNVL